jgi:hypothetical protein
MINIDDLRGEMEFVEDIIYCNEEFQALDETFIAQVTFQQFLSIKNPRWSKDEIALWANNMGEVHYWSSITKENRATTIKEVDTSLPASRWRKHILHLHPIGARNFTTVVKSLGRQITDAGVKGECITLRFHYDNDEEDEYDDYALDDSLEKSQDYCASEGQLDG